MSRLQVQSHSLVLLEGLGDLIGALRRGRGHCYVVRTCSRVQHAQGDTDKDQQTNRPTITIHSTLLDITTRSSTQGRADVLYTLVTSTQIFRSAPQRNANLQQQQFGMEVS